MNNKPYFLALNRINGVGPRTVYKLLQRWPDLAEMFSLSKVELIQAGLSEKIASSISNFVLDKVQVDLCWQQKQENHHLLTWEDKDYPALLKEIHDAPPVLYAIGDLSCLNTPALAMVGSRKPSSFGYETAYNFAKELAASRLTIVSGLALGIDAASHLGCLSSKGQTIAVMGTGIDCIYPRRHQSLAEKIALNGLIISEFPLGTGVNAGHFPRRNRIISGLTLATLVVEAAVCSGSLITARMALEQNRDVLAIPGSIQNPRARGCNYLLRQGAKLIECVQDILEELNLDILLTESKLENSVAIEEESLVKFVGFEATSIDTIAQKSGMALDNIIGEIVQLELQGLVKSVPGGYMRCI